MCRKLMYLTSFALVLSLVSRVPAQDTADVLIHYPYISIPVIDGFVDDVWSFSTEQSINVHINADPPSGATDCSGTWRALWDWEYLYLLVEVKDEMLLHDSTYDRSWEDDSVEVYVDGDNSKRISVDENDHQYCFRWYTQVETPRAHHHGEPSLEGVEYAVDTNSNGYLFEIRLPWVSIMGKQPSAGQLIGIDVFINDDDDGGSRDTQISWYATDGTGWNTPSMWGTGLLVAGNAFTAIDPSLVIYYSFDDVSRIIADQSGKGHDGIVNGNITAETDGKYNGAANFASGSYLDLDGPGFSAEDIPTSAITLAAWVKCKNTGGHHAIFNARASDATWLIHTELRSNGQFRWLLRAYGGFTIFDIYAGSVTWDEWLHYASTYDQAAGKAILYINGEVVREENVTNPRNIAGDWDRGARVGYNIDNARPFTGLMDDFCLFKRALPQAEVQGVMEEGGIVPSKNVYYVDTNATGNNDGSSWVDAYRYLQDALADANEAQKPVDIRVAQGTYTPDCGNGYVRGDKQAKFLLKSGVTIKGGFAGVGADDPNAWDHQAYETVLSGDLSGNDERHLENFVENSDHVIWCIEGDASAVLDGFTITGGYATDRIGGGLLNYNANPTVKRCVFFDNYASQGGGMANRYSSPTVTDCTFDGNLATYGGGGMYNTDQSHPMVESCVFHDNRSTILGGGGMYCGDSNPTVINCLFVDNVAPFGGGMYNVAVNPFIGNCTFTNNRSSSWGGGIQNDAGANPTVTNCILWGDIPDEIAFSGSATVTYSDVEGGWAGIGNIDRDPKFADAEGRLSSGSPCIDAGNNDAVPSGITTDLYGNPRILNGTVDIGASERGPQPRAGNPSPADGATTGQRTPVLHWPRGDAAVKYDVYFGTALADVDEADILDQSGIYRGRCSDPSYVTEQLDPDGTYYWRIDEVEADGETIHKGDVWSFTVVDRITVEYQVSSSEDDAYATNQNLQSVDAEYLKVGSSTFANPPYYMSGMVFRNVTVPRDAEIVSAHLKIRSYNSRLTGSVYGVIEAEAADDSAAFDNYRYIDSLSTTVNSVIWDHDEPWLEDTWYDSPDLVDVIQEVINREGWSAGNSLAILYSTRSEGDYRNFSSYDRGGSFAPKLEITYAPR